MVWEFTRIGNECLARQEYARAELAFRKALEVRPSDLSSQVKLGETLLHLGLFNKSESYCRSALEQDPRNASAFAILGAIQGQQGLLAEAEVSFQRVTLLRPDSSEAHRNLGVTQLNRGKPDEAEASFRRGLAIDCTDADTLASMGSALIWANRIAEAEYYLRQALIINANHLEALTRLSEIESYRGRFKESDELLRHAWSIDQNSPPVLAAMGNSPTMGSVDASWLATAEKYVHDPTTPPGQKADLWYAMGKYCNDTENFDRAFSNYRRANELKKILRGKQYDRLGQSTFVDKSISFYSRERIQQLNEGSSDSTLPVFVVGMPRSGTTLVEQIIASHASAFGAGELTFWDKTFWKYLASDGDPPSSDDAISNIAREYLQLLSEVDPVATKIVDKMPGNFSFLGLIHTAFPKARIIHVRRNPIDTCLSIYFQNFSHSFLYANDLEDLAHYYREYHRLISHYREVLPPRTILEVPYESLIEGQEYWSRTIIEFIGLDWDERCLDFHKTQRTVTTASKWQVRQKMYKTSLDRWRHYEMHLGPLLDLMGLAS